MSRSQHLNFYLTQSQPCSYLEQTSRSICLDPALPLNGELFNLLSHQGFRRSGGMLYRPHCPSCNACVSVRVPVEHFKASHSQQRILRRGARLQVSEHAPLLTDEYYHLYERYISARHSDGSMFPPGREQFSDFLTQPLPFARFYEFRLDGHLMAVAASDLLEDGLSAVYSFYDPDDRYFSLGRYAVLWQIEYLKQLQLPYLYLGYWIRNCRKMSYKTDYQPLQGYFFGAWRRLPDEAGQADPPQP